MTDRMRQNPKNPKTRRHAPQRSHWNWNGEEKEEVSAAGNHLPEGQKINAADGGKRAKDQKEERRGPAEMMTEDRGGGMKEKKIKR
jgi:hypothetical protein